MNPAIHFNHPGRQLSGIAVTVTLHVAVLAAILSYAPVREALLQFTPVMVSLLPPTETLQPAPKPKPAVKQIPRHTEPVAQPPQATREAVPASTAAPLTAPPTPVETRSAEPVASTPAPTATQPRFDADYLNNPAPSYPALSRRLGEQGRVMLRVLVDVRGLPERIELRASSGFDRLDQTALDTVKRWKFVPARRGDDAVSAWVLVPISFSLRG